jgi:H+/gluconate symporter-like permease
LILVAYRGFSVILFAPVAALVAVVCTDPALVLPYYSGVFMDRLASFVKLYFPMFLLGAVFGKLIELSGFAHSIVHAILGVLGPDRAILSVVIVCAVLTYGGVSLFVVVFAVYPFAAELYRKADVPKRLLPATIALGAFTFTMDALPGSPQVQNLIPTAFFQTDAWAAPWMGVVGSVFIFVLGMAWLEWRRHAARKSGEGYGEGHINEPAVPEHVSAPSPAIAIVPLLLVGGVNLLFGAWIRYAYGGPLAWTVKVPNAPPIEIAKVAAVWSVEGALLAAILFTTPYALRRSRAHLQGGITAAVGGALLAVMNVASEYGFGAVIAVLSGFHAIQSALSGAISDPLLNVAITTNSLAAVTGSSSGGLSIALASMGETYLEAARAAGIPAEVLHRVATMASGGMDTLPHNGAIITLLAITGLTHRQSYSDIFAMTGIKVAAVFAVIGFYWVFRVY